MQKICFSRIYIDTQRKTTIRAISSIRSSRNMITITISTPQNIPTVITIAEELPNEQNPKTQPSQQLTSMEESEVTIPTTQPTYRHRITKPSPKIDRRTKKFQCINCNNKFTTKCAMKFHAQNHCKYTTTAKLGSTHPKETPRQSDQQIWEQYCKEINEYSEYLKDERLYQCKKCTTYTNKMPSKVKKHYKKLYKSL